MKNSFFVRIALPKGLALETREALSRILTEVASRFSFQGLEDWTVDLPSSTKVLGAEREFHDLRNSGRVSDEIRVYFSRKADGANYARLIRASIEDLKVYPPRALAKKDWMKEWRKHYRTQKIEGGGIKLFIVPAWKKAPKGVAVKIHPGQAFGTGTHATTRLCLLAFLEHNTALPAKAKLLDFGAGTGVLALAALALAAQNKKTISAVAVESDRDALEQCGKNTRLNRRKMKLSRKMPKGAFDFIFANVLAPVLLEHRDSLVARLKPGGLIVVSGILATEAEGFQKQFNHPGIELHHLDQEGDWVAFGWRKI